MRTTFRESSRDVEKNKEIEIKLKYKKILKKIIFSFLILYKNKTLLSNLDNILLIEVYKRNNSNFCILLVYKETKEYVQEIE